MVMDSGSGRVLIVDDEVNIRHGLRAVLARSGHMVKEAGSVEEALTVLETFDCEVAILDIRMPGASGIELLQTIRGRWPHVAAIMLTGHGTLESAMVAVKAGAHDYLLKPVQPEAIRQTVAKALATVRRQRERAQLLESLRLGLQRLGQLPGGGAAEEAAAPEEQQIQLGALRIDLPAHEVHRHGAPVSVSPSEFKLLVALASRPGRVIDYVTLVQMSLDYEAEAWEAKELIKRHIFSLRRKIEPDPSTPIYILNVRGVGYRFASAGSLEAA